MPEIRVAGPDDNGHLLALTRATPMPGVIGLRIDRDPDFFRLQSLRGEGDVLVQEEDGRIQGCISLSHRRVWAAGAERPLWYVGDLKVHPDYRKSGVGSGLAVAALEYLVEQGADLLACVVAEGNRRVLTFLEGKFQIPPFRSLGHLDVLLLLSSRKGPDRRYRVRQGRPEDAPGLAELYQVGASRFELSPVLTQEDWKDALEEDPEVCRVLVAGENGRIQAAAWLFDVQWAKQHVVISLSKGLGLLTAPLRPLGRISPAFKIPRAGETVSLLSLRHLSVEGEGQGALRALVQEARRLAHAAGFPFLVYGLHERDPLRSGFRRLPRFSMGSELFLTSLQDNHELVAEVARGIPVEDYALA